MSARTAQFLIAAVFLVLGGWCLFAPASVIELAITEAFRHGQASAVAPFEYSALAWGLGLDWIIWQSLPAAHTWLGAAIIIGSGLWLVRHEQRITEAHANPDRV